MKTNKSKVSAKARLKYGKPFYKGRIIIEENDQTVSITRLFGIIRKACRDQLSRLSFDTWIAACKPILYTNGTLILCVENEIYKKILDQRYKRFMELAAKEAGYPINIEIITLK